MSRKLRTYRRFARLDALQSGRESDVQAADAGQRRPREEPTARTRNRTSLPSIVLVAAAAVVLSGAGQVRAQYEFGEPENLGPVVNSEHGEGRPSISADGLTLFFESNRPGGLGDADLWMTTRSSTIDPWQTPENLGELVNSSTLEGTPNITADGLTLFFASSRPGSLGSHDLWMTTRASTADPWQSPVNLGPTVNSADSDWAPNISADQLTLYFQSLRPGGLGAEDVWMTTRTSTSDPWQPPVHLGPPVNSSSRDGATSISADGLTLFFVSNRCGGLGNMDLWLTTRTGVAEPWLSPVNLGDPVNTSAHDTYTNFWDDGLTLFFRSNRPGGFGGYDLYQVDVTPTCVELDGICEPGEDCLTCPPDCLSGASIECGNLVCEPTVGEDCISCPSDCNGKQKGNPGNRFCCGDCGADNPGHNPVGCADSRCTSDGFDCSFNPVPSTCCGDGFCEGAEDSVNCGVDCGAGCTVPADCDDFDPCTIEDCVGTVCVYDPVDCDDGDACTADSCSGGLCFNDPIDCDDGDACSVDTCDPGSGCVNTFPDCDPVSDGCCGPACNPGNDPDCPCGAKNDPCTVNEDCCSLNCRPSGKCSG